MSIDSGYRHRDEWSFRGRYDANKRYTRSRAALQVHGWTESRFARDFDEKVRWFNDAHEGHTPAGEESNLFPPLWNSLGKGKRGESRFSKRKSFPISRGKGARANKGFTTMDADGNADGIGQGDTEMTVRRYTCFRLVPPAVWESLWPDHRVSFDAPRLIRAETSSRCRNRAAHPQALSPLRPASRLNNGAHIRRAIRHTPPPRFQQMPPFLSCNLKKNSLCHSRSLTFSTFVGSAASFETSFFLSLPSLN